jgi:hypothetical protein
MPTRLLLKPELDAAGCDMPDCGHDHSVIYLHAACHPHSATRARYEKALGHLIIACHKCGTEVARIAVAENVP